MSCASLPPKVTTTMSGLYDDTSFSSLLGQSKNSGRVRPDDTLKNSFDVTSPVFSSERCSGGPRLPASESPAMYRRAGSALVGTRFVSGTVDATVVAGSLGGPAAPPPAAPAPPSAGVAT